MKVIIFGNSTSGKSNIYASLFAHLQRNSYDCSASTPDIGYSDVNQDNTIFEEYIKTFQNKFLDSTNERYRQLILKIRHNSLKINKEFHFIDIRGKEFEDFNINALYDIIQNPHAYIFVLDGSTLNTDLDMKMADKVEKIVEKIGFDDYPSKMILLISKADEIQKNNNLKIDEEIKKVFFNPFECRINYSDNMKAKKTLLQTICNSTYQKLYKLSMENKNTSFRAIFYSSALPGQHPRTIECINQESPIILLKSILDLKKKWYKR
jgi:hypothetical protein